MYCYVVDRARGEGLTGWDYEAVTSLFLEPIQPRWIEYAEVGWTRDYAEGQHRSIAMMDAGVRRTVVLIQRPIFGSTPRNRG